MVITERDMDAVKATNNDNFLQEIIDKVLEIFSFTFQSTFKE